MRRITQRCQNNMNWLPVSTVHKLFQYGDVTRGVAGGMGHGNPRRNFHWYIIAMNFICFLVDYKGGAWRCVLAANLLGRVSTTDINEPA